MSSKPTQAQRVAELTTALGKDKLVLTRLDVSEGLSELFEIRAECLSEDENLDLGSIIGKVATVRFTTAANKKRFFSGVAVEASWNGREQNMFAYRVVLRPWTWLLSQATDSRIFQNQSVVDIIKAVFDKAGFSGQYDASQLESYPPIEYCVQYRESHLNFVLRLMEQFGIYYFFRHEAGKHTMVLADSTSAHKPIPDLPKVRFAETDQSVRDDEEVLREWASERRFRSGKVVVKAFDFAKPTADTKSEKSAPGGYEKDSMEVFLYPHKYKKGEEGDLGQKYVNATLHSLQSQDKRRYAAGNAPSIFPGGLITPEKLKPESEVQEYLVVSAQHTFVTETFRSGSGGKQGDPYYGHYVLQPKDRPFRAPIVTPKPVIYGPQTAVVVGPKGEEIHTDKYGRVKLQFHWDREGKKDEKSSRWVRVSQIWSGKQWGGFYVPRIGMEAVVEFIEGDPDRPLVVGTVYNAENMPPVEMPANQTQHGMKTRSSKGGGEANYNELVFEDKKGSEFIRMHAEKVLDVTVEDTESWVVNGKNRKGPGDAAVKTKIEKGDDVFDVLDGNQNTTISNDWTVNVGNDIFIEAGNQITLKVGISTIVMTKDAITVKSGTINTDAPFTNINATTVLDQKGGVIQLNCG
ncbi:MAG: hypothetical protein BGP06_01440 [Rhizobiales bacterium 65-9]|nr:type VI secretion system tip protein VgrG [Hyphomicrobiales bacterium]OJY37627.1 MAG: hypothetical protein BGP06_01440 [Rhizobiales bacterium 65-9]